MYCSLPSSADERRASRGELMPDILYVYRLKNNVIRLAEEDDPQQQGRFGKLTSLRSFGKKDQQHTV